MAGVAEGGATRWEEPRPGFGSHAALVSWGAVNCQDNGAQSGHVSWRRTALACAAAGA